LEALENGSLPTADLEKEAGMTGEIREDEG